LRVFRLKSYATPSGLDFLYFLMMMRSLFRESGLMSAVWEMGMPSVSEGDLGLVLLCGLDIFFCLTDFMAVFCIDICIFLMLFYILLVFFRINDV
jgi:hypothetical protein